MRSFSIDGGVFAAFLRFILYVAAVCVILNPLAHGYTACGFCDLGCLVYVGAGEGERANVVERVFVNGKKGKAHMVKIRA